MRGCPETIVRSAFQNKRPTQPPCHASVRSFCAPRGYKRERGTNCLSLSSDEPRGLAPRRTNYHGRKLRRAAASVCYLAAALIRLNRPSPTYQKADGKKTVPSTSHSALLLSLWRPEPVTNSTGLERARTFRSPSSLTSRDRLRISQVLAWLGGWHNHSTRQ